MTVGGWMLALSAVALFAWLFGLAAERLVERIPQRVVWLVAIAASLVVGLSSGGRPVFGTGGGGAGGVSSGGVLGLGGDLAALPPSFTQADRLLMVAWISASLIGLVVLVRAAMVLRRARRTWWIARVAGSEVYVSRRAGPAVVGVRGGGVVVPEWVLELDAESQRLLLAHEREHVRAGDPYVLLTGLLVLVAFPWNVGLWLQVKRLREAVEVDCDRRVVRGEVDRERYLSLLVDAAERLSLRPMSGVGLSMARPPIERRVRLLAGLAGPLRGRKALPAALAMPMLAASALVVPPQSTPDFRVILLGERVPAEVSAGTDRGSAMADISRPELLNRHQAPAIVSRSYPAALRNAGVEGTVIVGAYVAPNGSVEVTSIVESSGFEQLDEAARRAVLEFRFQPAIRGGRAVATWTQQPVTYISAADGSPTPSEETPPSAALARVAIWMSGANVQVASR